MAYATQHSMQLPRPLEQNPDPHHAMRLPFRRTFHPLGFSVEIETNSEEILAAAAESWGEQNALPSPALLEAPLTVRLGVTASGVQECPPAPNFRADCHLLSIVADKENFAACDLERGFAFGWVNDAALLHRSYFRYHFLEAIVMCLLTGSRVTPIHAACVSLNGHGFLLCGESGAGKSTLAYACARAGFTLTSDDASYVVWEQDGPARVRANCHQVRFRPSGCEFFSELEGRSLTPRAEGKPSIEIRTAELPHISVAPEASVHTILLLRRHPDDAPAELRPFTLDQVLPHLTNSLYPLDGIHQRQSAALEPLMNADMYEFRYTQCMVEDVFVCGRMNCAQVVTVLPVAFEAELSLNPLIERSARQRVGDGDADIVGARLAHQFDGLAYLWPAFSRITEL